VQSADRALQILGSFGPDRRSVGVSELADELGIHKSTVSRLLRTLKRRGFVRPDGARFVPGIEVVRIARLASPEEELAAAAGPALAELAADTGETVVLGVRRGDDAYFVRQVQGSGHILGVAEDWAGRSTPLHVSAIGKAILAFAREPYTGALERLTPHTITDQAALESELRRVRLRGWATLRDELEVGLTAVGAPVFDAGGDCIAGVSVTGPTFRLGRSVRRLGERCRACAAEITRAAASETALVRAPATTTARARPKNVSAEAESTEEVRAQAT
jgi:DNA-binding IclR family transcriptional regulator